MKLRIEDHSLRLRLSATEVQEFAQTGRVAATVQLGPGPQQQLTYALERTAVATVQLRYTPGCIVVQVPATVADAWTSTAQNGFSALLPLPENPPLHILVEKDLDCRH